MRCLSTIAAFLVLAALPLFAQRGGGGGHGFSGGGHGGGFSSHGSFGGGSHFSGGGHAYSGFHSGTRPAARSFSRGAYSRSFAPRSFSQRSAQQRSFSRGSITRNNITRNNIASRNFNQFNRGFNRGGTRFNIRTRGFGNCIGIPCRGYGWGYPYLWGLDAYGWGDDSGYDQDQQNDYATAQQMDQDSLADQQDQQMRQQYEQNQYARSDPPQPHQPERTEPTQPTVLIFRDQHQQEVQNYAIVGQTLWTFAPQKTQKIPLSDLDIPATTKVNDERGVDFRLPNAGEGQ